MTFAELEARARYEILAEQYEDQYLTTDIQERLWDSSVEIAALFGFPAVITTVAVTAGATTVTAPADIRRVLSLSINSDDAKWASIQEVYKERTIGQGALTVYNYDPLRGGDIEIGPATNYTGNAYLEYVQALTKPGTLGTAVAWNGLLLDWHWLIAYHAAIRLMQAAEREDAVPYWQQVYQSGITSFAIYLGRKDIADMLIGGLRPGPSAQAEQPAQPGQQQQPQLGYGGALGQ